MPRLPRIKGKEVITVLKQAGFCAIPMVALPLFPFIAAK
jgi:hypothetical protein